MEATVQKYEIKDNRTSNRATIVIDVTALVGSVKHPDKAELLGRAYQVQADIEALSLELTQTKVQALTAQHTEAKRAAREARDAFNSAKQSSLMYQRLQLDAENLHTKAIRALRGQKDMEPTPDMYPTDAEIQRWKDNASQAEASANDAARELQLAVRDHNIHQLEVTNLEAAYKAAQTSEAELRSQLNALKGISTEEDRRTFGLR